MSQTFLIAAHDPWVIQLFRIYAEESGFQISQAYESQDVFANIQVEIPTVILIEADIPGHMKGWEVLTNLRAEPETRGIPILVFSWQDPGISNSTGEDKTEFLQGPVTYDSFVDALKKVGICCPVKPSS
jgi:DNA-binding response OmpR family regulator